MATRGRSPRGRDPRPSGRHFLKSRRIAAELIDQAGVCADDLVLEIGAGTGRLTEALMARARRVIAVELAPDLARRLRRSFATDVKVDVLEADILRLSCPVEPFRAFGNLPFALSTAILRWLLDDPRSSLLRADVILQYEVGRKRASVWPSTLLSLGWMPWWEFALVRRLARRSFEPLPAVDAGMLRVTRRDPPLLQPADRPAISPALRTGLRRSPMPVRRSLPGLTSAAWRRLADERGLPFQATATDLDVYDWVELSRAIQELTVL
ncbi:MAG: ribosomal RNA small subunit methyltransferase A [Actinomycetota bacterium]